MNSIRQAVRSGKTETAQRNKHLQANYTTKKFNLLNAFYTLVALYWLVMLWGLL
jgi:ethanolamine utilization cobalamin adenosyltransferase